jgi:excisionase family DNA binding protein
MPSCTPNAVRQPVRSRPLGAANYLLLLVVDKSAAQYSCDGRRQLKLVIVGLTFGVMSAARPSEFLFIEDVAREARASVESVRRWVKSGRLPSSRPGKRRLVRRGDLDVFLSRNGKGALKSKGEP